MGGQQLIQRHRGFLCLSIFTILNVYSSQSQINPDDGQYEEQVTNSSGLLGRNARLPCDIRPPSPDHPLLLVIWFKEPSPDPIYSYDVRGNGVEIGRHWNDGINLGARARFDERARPFPLLWIEDLREDDEGVYRCRVDFKQAPTKNFQINLSVIVPPGRPLIHNERGILVEKVLGPYSEGVELMLTCSVGGGKPPPNLFWLINGRAVAESKSIQIQQKTLPDPTSRTNSVVSSSLLVGVVQRDDVDTTYTCLASNSNMTQASREEVKLEMNLLPIHVRITSPQTQLSADRVYDIHCITFGSRPSALVTWWLGNTQLLDHSTKPANAGNVTESTLRFQPKVIDIGKLLRCRAENPVMPESQMEDIWRLEINYLPRVSLRFGSTLKPQNIKEGDDVYFECLVQAKPNVYKIEWKFNGRDLRQDVRNGVIMGNQSLVLQSLNRNATGHYQCLATNEEGTATSNQLRLDIKYKPVCADHQKLVYGVAHGEIASINCTVRSNPEDQLQFHWTFNSSSELNTLPESRFRTTGPTSQLVYSLNTGRDYGTILCWAENQLGRQDVPCVFHLIPAVPPAAPLDCHLINLTSHSIVAKCRPGFDGGLPQHFQYEIYDLQGQSLANSPSPPSTISTIIGNPEANQIGRASLGHENLKFRPEFQIDRIPPDTDFQLLIFAANAKGRSEPFPLRGRTRQASLLEQQQKQLQQQQRGSQRDSSPSSSSSNVRDQSDNAIKFSFSAESTLTEQGELKPRATLPEKQGAEGIEQRFQPYLSIVGGIGCGLVLMTLLILITMRLRFRPGGAGIAGGSAPSSFQASQGRTWRTDSGEIVKLDDKDMDPLAPSPGPLSIATTVSGSQASLLQRQPLQVRHHYATLPHNVPPAPPPRKPSTALTSLSLRGVGRMAPNRRSLGGEPRPDLVTSTLPRNFHAKHPTSTSYDALQLLQNGLPSPPEPPSFQISALALDLPMSEIPPSLIDCDIVLPPPALYTLPRRATPTSGMGNGKMDNRTVRFMDGKSVKGGKPAPLKRRKSKSHTESVV